MASLWGISGPLAGQSVRITGDLVIGRQSADLEIDDTEVSRRHAVLRLASGTLQIEDLGSSNGTFVDDKRIEGPVEVTGGTKIQIGQSVLVVRGVLPSKDETDAPVAAAQLTAAGPVLEQAGAFAAPERRRARGLASRSWAPVVLSYGTAVLTAAALIVYFAVRGVSG
jgi:pSer/pThr/pTyr-binding forkhead associated (FHA) protein